MKKKRQKKTPQSDVPRAESVRITPEDIQAYLTHLEAEGRTMGTVKAYEAKLRLLLKWMPEPKEIRKETLSAWRDAMLEEGYSASTVNSAVTAANRLLAFLDRREFQFFGTLSPDSVTPELSRTEYMRLLNTARNLGRERTYLLVKLFGCVGLRLKDLSLVTVATVAEGILTVPQGDGEERLAIPGFLQEEILDYAQRMGIGSGPIFQTRLGIAMLRSQVSADIRKLCRDARVPEEKGNPRCLRKLCLYTQEAIRDNIELLVDQAYDRLLRREQQLICWNEAQMSAPEEGEKDKDPDDKIFFRRHTTHT